MNREERINSALAIYTNPNISSENKKKHLTWLLSRIGCNGLGEEPNIPGFTIPSVNEIRFNFSGIMLELLKKLGWEEFQKRVNKWRAEKGQRQGGKNPWVHRNQKFFLSAIKRLTGFDHDGTPVKTSTRINEETAMMLRDLLIEVRAEG